MDEPLPKITALSAMMFVIRERTEEMMDFMRVSPDFLKELKEVNRQEENKNVS